MNAIRESLDNASHSWIQETSTQDAASAFLSHKVTGEELLETDSTTLDSTRGKPLTNSGTKFGCLMIGKDFDFRPLHAAFRVLTSTKTCCDTTPSTSLLVVFLHSQYAVTALLLLVFAWNPKYVDMYVSFVSAFSESACNGSTPRWAIHNTAQFTQSTYSLGCVLPCSS